MFFFAACERKKGSNSQDREGEKKMKSYLLQRFLEDLKSKQQSAPSLSHTRRIVNLAYWVTFLCTSFFCYIYDLITAAGFGFRFHDKVMFALCIFLCILMLRSKRKERVPDAFDSLIVTSSFRYSVVFSSRNGQWQYDGNAPIDGTELNVKLVRS